MKKFFLLVLTLLLLTSCSSVELNPEWYPRGLWKDDIFVSRPNGKFNIGQYSKNQALSVNTDDGRHDILLSSVTDHKRIKDKVYVYSDEGYCVIDENTNTAEVLVVVEEQHAVSGTNDPAVTYLKSFDDFSDEAKKIFTEMEEYWSDKDYRRYGSHDKVYPDGTIVYSNNAFFLIGGIIVAHYLVVIGIFFLIRYLIKQKKKK